MNRSLVPILLALLTSPALADVLTVGPTGDHPDIQSAVSAAAEGDTILVGPGVTTDPGFNVSGKSLAIVADQDEAISMSGIVFVGYLAPGQTVLLAGLQLDIASGQQPAVWLYYNAGAVRLQDCRISAVGRVGVRIFQCDDVAFVDCDISVSTLAPNGPRGGLWIGGSMVALDGCVIQAPSGSTAIQQGSTGADGGDSLVVATSLVHASGCTFTGGTGGTGAPCLLSSSGDGGPGGAGVLVASGNFRYRDCTFAGGAGGPPGSSASPNCSSGTFGASGPATTGFFIVEFPGPHRALDAPAPTRELVNFPITLQAAPGELAAVIWGLETAHATLSPVSWPLLVSLAPPSQILLVGVVPPGGTITANIAFPELGPGVESVRVILQPIVQSTSGELILGAPTTLVGLDGAF